jgi:hypothetical protein
MPCNVKHLCIHNFGIFEGPISNPVNTEKQLPLCVYVCVYVCVCVFMCVCGPGG